MIEVWKAVAISIVILGVLFIWAIYDSRKDKKNATKDRELYEEIYNNLYQEYQENANALTIEKMDNNHHKYVVEQRTEALRDCERDRDRFYTDHIALEYLALDTGVLDKVSGYSIKSEGLSYPVLSGESYTDLPFEFALRSEDGYYRATVTTKKFVRTVNDVDKWTFKAVLMKLPDDVVERIEELFI